VAALAAGAVVLVRFPFSDLSQAKLRPAAVVAKAGRGDWLLCQITSNPYSDPAAITLAQTDFRTGSLRITSHARPLKLFTANEAIIAGQLGELHDATRRRITTAIIAALQAQP
jgi:mRNA interferase MazF